MCLSSCWCAPSSGCWCAGRLSGRLKELLFWCFLGEGRGRVSICLEFSCFCFILEYKVWLEFTSKIWSTENGYQPGCIVLCSGKVGAAWKLAGSRTKPPPSSVRPPFPFWPTRTNEPSACTDRWAGSLETEAGAELAQVPAYMWEKNESKQAHACSISSSLSYVHTYLRGLYLWVPGPQRRTSIHVCKPWENGTQVCMGQKF